MTPSFRVTPISADGVPLMRKSEAPASHCASVHDGIIFKRYDRKPGVLRR
jgi:hypothetical protein